MKRRLFTYVFIFHALLSAAQYFDSLAYYAGYTSTGSFNRTNNNRSYLLNNGIKLGVRKKVLSLNSSTKWLYGQQNGVLTNNDVSTNFDANLYKTFPHFYYWGLAAYNSIYSLHINSQFQGGAGIAYRVIDKGDERQVSLSDGIIYDYSNVVLNDNTGAIYGTFRNSFRLQVKYKFRNMIVFSGNCFLQHSLQYSRDYIIRSDVSLSLRLRKWLMLTGTFSYNEISRTQRQNLFITYGITIENYF
ncbi:MAG: DUF481 domain-containing protein [Bacteroidia bacterium]